MNMQDIRENLSSNWSLGLLQSGLEACPVCGEW